MIVISEDIRIKPIDPLNWVVVVKKDKSSKFAKAHVAEAWKNRAYYYRLEDAVACALDLELKRRFRDADLTADQVVQAIDDGVRAIVQTIKDLCGIQDLTKEEQ